MRTIICLTGIDGSGKTTLAHFVLRKLKNKGLAPKYIWCRWFPGPADPFHFMVKKSLGYDIKHYDHVPPLKLIYQALLFLGHTAWLTFKIRLSRENVIIMDRYLYDAFADLYMSGLRPSPLFIKLTILINPKPDITFLIDVPPDVIQSRRKNVSIQDSTKYKRIFDIMYERYGFNRVDNTDFSDACTHIMDQVLCKVSLHAER